jgi:hypothetical protein
MNSDDSDEALRRLMDRGLRDLPQLHAPATLEARVLAELERRAALPWWRRSFTYWPQAARAAFLVICGALAKLALIGGATAVAAFLYLRESAALTPPWARHVGALVTSAANLSALVARSVPENWIREGLAVWVVLYVVLFGLGAAMYRTLYLQPLNGR